MKEHSVSHSTAPPANVKITYDPSADALMADWLAERVRCSIAIAIDAAPRHDIRLKEIWVEGWKSYEEPTRELVVVPEIDASDDSGFEYLGVLAEAIHRLNEPAPRGATNRDVSIQVSVRW